MGPEVGEARFCLTKSVALRGCPEVVGGLPPPNVHEAEVGVGRDGLVERRIDVAGLGLQVVASISQPRRNSSSLSEGTSKALISVRVGIFVLHDHCWLGENGRRHQPRRLASGDHDGDRDHPGQQAK